MVVNLPEPKLLESDSLVACIGARRSVREYANSPLPIEALSQLLWSAQGVTGGDQKRATPSAGGLNPLQLKVVVQRVVDLESGVYEYMTDNHSLKLVGTSVEEDTLHGLGLGDQPWLNEAAVLIGVAANVDYVTRHFKHQPPQGERGTRYVYLETGALTQNVHLQSTALRLGCVLVAGFDDAQVKEALMLSSDFEPTALLCIGQRRYT